MRRQNKDWNARKAYEERTKKSAASDEYIHNFRQERKRTAEYDTEQGAGLPNSLIKQARKNQEVNEAASRGEYTTKHRSGQVRTHKLPQDEAIDYFSKWIEDPSIPDQVKFPLEQASLTMQNLLKFTEEEDATLSYVNAFKTDPPEQPAFSDPTDQGDMQPPEVKKQEPDEYTETTIAKDKEDVVKKGKVGDAEWNKDSRWTGEEGDRKLSKPTPIQENLKEAGFKDEQLIKLMEKNQEFQADRPKVSDLLKIFKKG